MHRETADAAAYAITSVRHPFSRAKRTDVGRHGSDTEIIAPAIVASLADRGRFIRTTGPMYL